MDNKKVLLRISNLKQYFPLKKKGLFVKANDGISIDIYEGETFGLVGESGCGKSTLGRTLLQLYPQTDGRTMYYGRTLDEIAPDYVIKTIRGLEGKRHRLTELDKKRDTLQKEYDELKTEQEKYLAKNDLDKAIKDSNDAFLDMTNIVGGFIIVEDLNPIMTIFEKEYRLFSKLRDKDSVRKEISLDYDDAKFMLDKANGNGENASKVKVKFEKEAARINTIDAEIAEIKKEIEGVKAEIDKMREPYKNNSEFQKLEAYRDDGIDLARLLYKEMRLLRSDMQLIFQDPYSSLNPRMSVGQIVGEGMIAHKYFKRNGERMQEAILDVMNNCGLAPYFIHRFPHQFSGGQRQRIGIARSLAVQPKFIVCDEAVSALDVSIQSQIINLLQDLKEDKHLTYMFITHDLSVVKYISDRIGVMYLGTIVELANADEMFHNPLHPYTEALLSAIPTTDVDSHRELVLLEGDIPSPVNPPKGCKFHTRCKYCTEICTHVIPDWQEIKPNHFVACHHMLPLKD
ncbi:MAG: ATP-binding cassette domain-containing protein [Clostridia bacterium]